VITRFAPSPTGYLHLGHVVNALVVWILARRNGGRVLLRIEDHDRQRSRPEYERAIFEDLAWLGFEPDELPVRQSDREGVYRAACARLAARGLLYGCACTRAGIEPAGGREASGPGAERRYPGTCRHRAIEPADGVGWRVRMDPGIERFDDLFCGPQEQAPSEQCGDLLIRDRLGNWTYQFAVVADDLAQSITHVIRGQDLLASSGRQIRLARLVGRTENPRFLHHPLVMRSPTEKLSKSDGATGVRELAAAGWTPQQVRNEARRRAGPALNALLASSL
jgi:glutamyl-Q tRNA(Asp) synthetase